MEHMSAIELLHQPMAASIRLNEWIKSIQVQLRCDAVGLLKREGKILRPIALIGLVAPTLGRRFTISEHPRLAQIIGQRALVHFNINSHLPDPYDGLLEHCEGQPLLVHDCMGISLWVNDQLWGALTFDSLEHEHFNVNCQAKVAQIARECEALIRVVELEQELQALRTYYDKFPVSELPANTPQKMIGEYPRMQMLLKELDIVAESDLTVLLTGETGVGKELFARRLHRQSTRHEQPLVQVNCAALPDSLVESELFGHVKGAFSGAITARGGRLEAADHGTLFLDEVGELPLSIQAKLLRVLQNGEIQRVGSDQIDHINIRVIAATNRNLQEMIKKGKFRADLYHRLSVYPVEVPPLRERGQDILLLAGYFVELNRSRFGFRSLRLSAEVEQLLLNYQWPGNIRELDHVISRAALRTVSDGVDKTTIVTIESKHLDVNVQEQTQTIQNPMSHNSLASSFPSEANLPLKVAIDSFQSRYIKRAVDTADGNWSQAAKQLKIDPSNLYKLAKRLGLK